MAGSTIFQLLPSLEGINDGSELMMEYDLTDCFVPSVADYLYDDCNRKEAFDVLVRHLTYRDTGYGADSDKYLSSFYSNTKIHDKDGLPEAFIVFHKGFKSFYFKRAYEAYKKNAEAMTLEKFMNGLTMFAFKNIIDDRYGYYIFDECRSYSTLDNWIRDYLKDDEESKFYLGTVINYHY